MPLPEPLARFAEPALGRPSAPGNHSCALVIRGRCAPSYAYGADRRQRRGRPRARREVPSPDGARIPGEATEAGVETHPAFRGHGYAAIATAAWARAMRDRGVIPLYSTAWENFASQRVAAKLSLIRYGASLSIE